MKIGIADIGLQYWDGGNYDEEQRWKDLKEIGYDGIERITAISADEALRKAALMRKMGFEFSSCRAPNMEASIQWNAALGKNYVYVEIKSEDLDTVARQADIQAKACEAWGIGLSLHNHMGTPVETQQQIEYFLEKSPSCGLTLDTAHLAAVGGDPVEIIRRYPNRIHAVHIKDWFHIKPMEPAWWECGRFCELGAGNIGMDHRAVVQALLDTGYDGWIFVEQDTHLQDPMKDLAISRQYLRNLGL